MTEHGIPRMAFLSVLWLGAFGCAYPISTEVRQQVTEDVTFPMVLQNPDAYKGDIVLWGGEIIETVNLQGGSEIIVLDTPLDYQERPEGARYSRGRFVAKTPKFLDPAIYKKGGKITLAGQIVGKEAKPLGKTEYAYPVVLVKQLHLWRRTHYGPYHPYWGWPYDDYWVPGYYYWPYHWGFYSDFDDDEFDQGEP